MIAICNSIDIASAPRSHLFESHVNFSCALIVPILTNSYRTNPVKSAVLASSIPKKWLMITNVKSKRMVFLVPIVPMSHANDLFIIDSPFFLGGFSIMFGTAGSNPRAIAGSPSVSKFIHSICIGKRIGSFSVSSNVARNKTPISAKLETNK